MENYHKIKDLGVGTFGKVSLCIDRTSEQKIVIKEIVRNHGMPQITQNEVLILAMLNHPNVIHYYNSFTHRGNLCIVMEYATHGTLHDYLRKQNKYLPQQYIFYIFAQILLAIDYIHGQNIIHRDLKAENVMITGEAASVIKLADFGISKILLNIDNNTTGTQIGTPNYLAPEVCHGKRYDMKADIWSLGCILYELCALKRMFEGPVATIILAITNCEIKRINSNIYCDHIQNWIEIMCHSKPEKRPNANSLLRNKLILAQVFSIQVNLGKVLANK